MAIMLRGPLSGPPKRSGRNGLAAVLSLCLALSVLLPARPVPAAAAEGHGLEGHGGEALAHDVQLVLACGPDRVLAVSSPAGRRPSLVILDRETRRVRYRTISPIPRPDSNRAWPIYGCSNDGRYAFGYGHRNLIRIDLDGLGIEELPLPSADAIVMAPTGLAVLSTPDALLNETTRERLGEWSVVAIDAPNISARVLGETSLSIAADGNAVALVPRLRDCRDPDEALVGRIEAGKLLLHPLQIGDYLVCAVTDTMALSGNRLLAIRERSEGLVVQQCQAGAAAISCEPPFSGLVVAASDNDANVIAASPLPGGTLCLATLAEAAEGRHCRDDSFHLIEGAVPLPGNGIAVVGARGAHDTPHGLYLIQ